MADFLLRAVLAEKCGRFHEMREYVTQLAKSSPHLDIQQRGLFTEAFRKSISIYRTGIRNLDQVAAIKQDYPHAKAEIQKYRQELVDLVIKFAKQGLDILVALARNLVTDDELVWAAKTKADFYRYMAEADRDYVQEAAKWYAEADTLTRRLRMGHELRLALLLNHSIFVYEIIGEHERAINMLKVSLEETPAAINPRDDSVIRSLMCHNLEMWQSVRTY